MTLTYGSGPAALAFAAEPAMHYHALSGLADTLAEAAGLPLGEVEALAEAQQAFVSLGAGLDDAIGLLQRPQDLVRVLETCFEAGLDPRAEAALVAAAHAFLGPTDQHYPIGVPVPTLLEGACTP